MTFTGDQMLRYSRQIVLPEIGGVGQRRLMEARVLVVGAGGLGSPLLMYLAAAGVGGLGIVDDDRVELSNLHRQIIHGGDRLGMAKTESARRTLLTINPEVRVARHDLRLDAEGARRLVEGYDLVADGSDNFPTRDVLHAACYEAGLTLVSAAIQGVDGWLSTFKAHLGPPHPCFRCVFPEPPPPGLMPSCAEAGVLGPAVGALGGLQAVEAVKELLGVGDGLSGDLLLYDALGAAFRRVRVGRAPACPVCGGHDGAGSILP